MSMLVRATQLRAVARPALRFQARSLHIENRVDEAIPGGSKRGLGFTLRFIGLYGLGAVLPFVATKISQDKAAGSGA